MLRITLNKRLKEKYIYCFSPPTQQSVTWLSEIKWSFFKKSKNTYCSKGLGKMCVWGGGGGASFYELKVGIIIQIG